MIDFASAAMMRLVQAGLHSQGIALSAGGSGTGAHVPLADKRSILTTVARQHGDIALLRIGAAVAVMPPEPALTALVLARDPVDLIHRWQRLERYVHSRHRIEHSADHDATLTLVHRSVSGEHPLPEEDLLVFGLMVALIEQLSDWSVDEARVGDSGYRYGDHRWHDGQRGPVTDTITVHLQRACLEDKDADAQSGDTRTVLERARGQIERDPSYSWTLDALASDLSFSSRSLQRRLQECGTSFSRLVMDVRTAQSAQMLAGDPHSLAEIGYACGFSDQAHFARAFKKRSAMTPENYRRAFAS